MRDKDSRYIRNVLPTPLSPPTHRLPNRLRWPTAARPSLLSDSILHGKNGFPLPKFRQRVQRFSQTLGEGRRRRRRRELSIGRAIRTLLTYLRYLDSPSMFPILFAAPSREYYLSGRGRNRMPVEWHLTVPLIEWKFRIRTLDRQGGRGGEATVCPLAELLYRPSSPSFRPDDRRRVLND